MSCNNKPQYEHTWGWGIVAGCIPYIVFHRIIRQYSTAIYPLYEGWKETAVYAADSSTAATTTTMSQNVLQKKCYI